MQRIKKTFYISLIALGFINLVGSLLPLFNACTKQAYAGEIQISAEDQYAITEIKNRQTATGSIVSEHVNKKDNGQTTVKLLEIPEHQLVDIIGQWEQIGHKIDGDTINDTDFIKYLINNADIKSFSYTANMPMLYFLVKHEIAEPILYGGQIKKFFKTISFRGWFKIAGALDAQGNYEKGYEHLGTQKEALIDLFKGVLAKTVKGSYTIVELYTDGNGERKGRFMFFTSPEQTEPTFVQPIDAMAAFVLTYLNLVQDNPGDVDVKKDLTIPIVQRLLTKA
ncbi:MAG: hypothetical protein D8M57_13795 [Candidatus Scalindua sp. AMX11]|nr:MAG: hypothetical protein DWQ00_06305 [Candidatus Scalindua sp.]NOG83405.1 hypothetical protein [Planctomycetota bacterium]RZV75083.1 MAG: hypothetical protein EX341_12820 [Candidatus Scalindua sp. SCAELEC01]TDE64346.1 MAG: hypothetical protein D8M57_13795 [Candidatus Scalindua sp. AMX11]GJQ60595.1 MAG: hypothetical protein SCALA701_33960 [Candidatus Scalindua sp.]